LPFGYKYLGEKTAKNVSKPIRDYKVIFEPDKFTKKLIGPISKLVKGDKESDPIQTGWLQSKTDTSTVSERKRLLASILCLAFGIFGAHRFYVGKTKTAKTMLFTIGGFGIWYIIDVVFLLFGEFTDREGRKVSEWL
jgi:hypothetical protein